MQVPTVGESVVQIDQDPFTLETRIAIGDDTCYQSAKIENINKPILTSNGIVYIISNILIPTPVIDYVKFHRSHSC
jgi:phosphomannomutase